MRGLGTRFLWHNGSFLYGFSYPFVLFAIVSIVCLPTYALNKKYAGSESEDNVEIDSGSKQPLPLQVFKGVGKLLLEICVFLFVFIVIPMLEGNILYYVFRSENMGTWKDESYCLNSNLFVLYAVAASAVIFSILSLHSSKLAFFSDPNTGERRPNRIPKGVRRRFTVLFLGVYLLTTLLYSSWFDLYTTEGLRVQRFLFHTEYTWEQAESFSVQKSSQGTLSLIITMQDGKNFNLMNGASSSGDMEEMGLELTKQLKEKGIPCLVKDWDRLREDLHKDDYWQDYMDELRAIIE